MTSHNPMYNIICTFYPLLTFLREACKPDNNSGMESQHAAQQYQIRKDLCLNEPVFVSDDDSSTIGRQS